jgi:hypothetical protein
MWSYQHGYNAATAVIEYLEIQFWIYEVCIKMAERDVIGLDKTSTG